MSSIFNLLLDLQEAHYELFSRYAAGQSEHLPEMRQVYETFFQKCNERFTERLAHHHVTMDEFQKRWDAHDETVRQDPVFKDLYDFQNEISSFEKFAEFMKSHVASEYVDLASTPSPGAGAKGGEPFEAIPPSDGSVKADEMVEQSDLSAVESRIAATFKSANDQEILVYWDTENVPPAEATLDSINQLRAFLVQKQIGNPIRMYVEAFFCPGSTATLSPKQMWGLRQSGVTMVACSERKKEEVDRQMERRMRRELTRTTPDKSVFVVISGDSDFNQIIEDVAAHGYKVHLLTPGTRSTVYQGSQVIVWTGFSFRGTANSSLAPQSHSSRHARVASPTPNAPTDSNEALVPISSVVDSVSKSKQIMSHRRLPLMHRSNTPPLTPVAAHNVPVCSRYVVKWWNGSAGVILSTCGFDATQNKEIFCTAGSFLDKKRFQESNVGGNLVRRVVLLYPNTAQLVWQEEKKYYLLEGPPCLDLEMFRLRWWKMNMGLMTPVAAKHPFPVVFIQKAHLVDPSLDVAQLVPGVRFIVRQVEGLSFQYDAKHGNYKLQSPSACLELSSAPNQHTEGN